MVNPMNTHEKQISSGRTCKFMLSVIVIMTRKKEIMTFEKVFKKVIHNSCRK